MSFNLGKQGFGLMNLTWRPKVTPDEQAFAVIKKAIDLGATFLNSGEFYGVDPPEANLLLLNRFFTKYPELASKTVLSVKGAMDNKTLAPKGTPEGIRESVDNILKALGGTKKLDLFECARVDKTVPIETTMATLGELIKEGKVGGISLSEVGPETIRRAAAAHKIEAVEVEFSLWSLEARELGVLQTCGELGIPVVAYSPLGRGFLTGSVKSRADIPAGDMRLIMERFSEENFPINLKLVDELHKIAAEKGVAPSHLALAWIKKNEQYIPGLKIVPIPGGTTVAQVEENFAAYPELTDAEYERLETVLKTFEVKGGRYFARAASHLWG
ncbi:NADP-dependent oxidoreductase domain-containing protein [Dipodascopsis tothii]|uniref:NADP-dependent oxidoreductase domain-containing protein n=1 Tax=Dipodascopsis tothii TaxID=44089 RepID=UPI0034CFC4C3